MSILFGLVSFLTTIVAMTSWASIAVEQLPWMALPSNRKSFLHIAIIMKDPSRANRRGLERLG